MTRSILLFIFLLAVSCESTQTAPPSFEGISFTTVDTQKVIVLQAGSEFQVSLPSNPSTGFQWATDSSAPDIVQLQSTFFVPDRSDRVGAAGETRWIFRAMQSGSTAITFSYTRPWEEQIKPSRVVTFNVDIR